MTEPYYPAILASQYARQEGVTTDAIVQRIRRGKMRGYKQAGHWYVETGPAVDVPIPNGALPVAPDSPVADGPVPQLTALADYNTRLIAPWVERVTELEETTRQQAIEIGDLRRQVRQLQRRVEGLMALVEQRQGAD